MDCAEEVAILKRGVGPVVGGEDRLSFDILHGRMAVTPGPDEVSPDAILQAVARTGMRAEVWRQGETAPEQKGLWQKYGQTAMTAASGAFTLLGFLAHAWLAGG